MASTSNLNQLFLLLPNDENSLKTTESVELIHFRINFRCGILIRKRLVKLLESTQHLMHKHFGPVMQTFGEKNYLIQLTQQRE